MPELSNPQHESFASLVALGAPYTSAYLDSGFNPSTRSSAYVLASRLMGRDDVRARVDELRGEFEPLVQKDFGITREWLLQALERNVRVAYGIEPISHSVERQYNSDGTVQKDESGNEVWLPVAKYEYQPTAANKSIELLGKLIGEFKDKVELSGPGGGPITTRLEVEFVGVVGEAIAKAASGD